MSTTANRSGETLPDRPTRSYLSLLTAFSTIFGGALISADRKGRLPERPALADLLLVAVAGHKLARLITTDEVTSPLRAPFIQVHLEDGKPVEEPTGTGPRRALGGLLTCPSCVGQWTCAAFFTGVIYRPRLARVAASIFAADAISDFLHTAYHAAKERA